MTIVQTVTGPVDHSELGVTLSHEHLGLESPGLPQQYPWLYDREASIKHITAKVIEAREAGVETIVEVSPPDLGRDIRKIEEISRRADVRVVACTGIWADIPRWFHEATVEEIADVFTHEIEQGIADTEIHPGVIKVANTMGHESRDRGHGPRIQDVEERVFRGAAQAAIRTRVPITTHCNAYDIGDEEVSREQVGRHQMRIFDDAGLPPHLVAIGHVFTDDMDYLHEVLNDGRYASIDLLGRYMEEEPAVLRAIAQLCGEGLADHILLSQDYIPEWDQRRLARHAEFDFTYVTTQSRAHLAGLGVAEADINTMLVTAPANFLAGGREE